MRSDKPLGDERNVEVCRNGHEPRSGEVTHAEHLSDERRPAGSLPIGAESRDADRLGGGAGGLSGGGGGVESGGRGGEGGREEEREGERGDGRSGRVRGIEKRDKIGSGGLEEGGDVVEIVVV